MVSRAKKVKKNKITRNRKKLMIIGTEGNNKTEENYFREMEHMQNEFHLVFTTGNETDPVNIVKNTIKTKNKEDISIKRGDVAISVFDLDVDEKKKPQLLEAKKLADNGHVRIITSNPCFEVWYLEHFGYSSKPFTSSNDVIKLLTKYCPRYQKNQCDFELFYPLTDKAIHNCKLLDEFHKNNGTDGIEEFNNPRTDVHRIVEVLIGSQSLD